jgi:Cd2+/Zn2+-exporting ATPase
MSATVTLKSPDIHCESCAAKVKSSTLGVAGVSKVEVDIPAQTVSVEYEPPADPEAITSALEEAGFDVTECKSSS